MSASPPKNEEGVFSVATLIKYMGNDDKALAVVAKIVRDACAPGMEPFRQAQSALTEGRTDDAGKILHSLRGSVGTLGAKRLVSSSLLLEQALAEQRSADVPSLFAALEFEYQLVLQYAAEWLRQNAPQSGTIGQA
jgi:hypothetical protein